MNSIKLVSILIATYNAEKFIKKTVQSCINQTYPNIEILIRDDSSSDNTVAIIESIGNEKVKLFKGEKNIGPYNGLNFLLEKAKGEYIAIQDHDDIWFPEKIKKQVEFLERNKNFVACGTNVYYFFEEKDLIVLKKFKDIESYVNHTSLMFRNDGFRYKGNSHFPDHHFEISILGAKGKIGCLQEGLTIHRIRSDGKNLSKNSKLSIMGNVYFLKENKLAPKSLMLAFYLTIRRIIPASMIWTIRRHLTMRINYKWIRKEQFLKDFPMINL